MANAPKKKSETKITRIVASDSSKPTTSKDSITAKATKILKKRTTKKAEKLAEVETKHRNPLRAIAAYFKGSWYELRQVRWPDRRATWGMTGALIAFTAFFIIVILILDYGFGQLFKLITGK